LHNSSRIKDSTKILIPSEETSYGNSSNDSKENSNNKNTSINNMLTLKTILTSFIFMGLANGFTRLQMETILFILF
jgi:hypothetical protein